MYILVIYPRPQLTLKVKNQKYYQKVSQDCDKTEEDKQQEEKCMFKCRNLLIRTDIATKADRFVGKITHLVINKPLQLFDKIFSCFSLSKFDF